MFDVARIALYSPIGSVKIVRSKESKVEVAYMRILLFYPHSRGLGLLLETLKAGGFQNCTGAAAGASACPWHHMMSPLAQHDFITGVT